jgi:mono/diheme cytochrome c family protein
MNARLQRLTTWAAQHRRWLIGIGTGIGVLAVLGVVGGYYLFFRVGGDDCSDADISGEQVFKCIPTGVEAAGVGVPYLIWLVLPDVFPEYLPGPNGYASLGMIYEEGAERPIGVPKVDVGVIPRVGLNCALCHTTTYRTSEEAEPVIVLGAPGRIDLQGYLRFLFRVVEDPKFNGDTIVEAIKQREDLSLDQEILYKTLVVPAMKTALREERERFAYAERNPDQGYGRIDPFNPPKFGPLGQPVDDTIGNSDFMSLWGLEGRTVLHWDGLQQSLEEAALSGMIGSGATADSLEVENILRIVDFVRTLEPPEYPFPVDEALAGRGEEVFRRDCASCHARGEGRTGELIPVEEVGTDRHRVDMWEVKDAQAYNDTFAEYPWGFSQFQDVDGYVAIPLDGIWIRAPYLHNGSVPNMHDLLLPPDERPKTFYRGYDVYDPETLSFVSDVAEDDTGQRYFLYDTSLPGNSNAGHEYGTTLSDEEKQALIEFLKTQ